MSAKFRSFSLDLFPFLGVVLMAAAVMVVVLVANVLAALGGSGNVRITSIIRSGGAGASAAEAKEACRVDVYRDHLVIYPGGVIVAVRDMDGGGNAFKQLMDDVSAKKDSRYILLAAHPGSATVVNMLKRRIRARGVDVGCELCVAGTSADFERAAGPAGREQAVQ